MAVTREERMQRIHELDLGRLENHHQIDLVNRDEEARRLKLRVLSLKDENATLKHSIAQRDARIASTTTLGDEVRVELDEAKELARTQEAKIKKQNIEISHLKAEIEALNNSIQDSGKALQEKFALTRELSRLRPEIEHLQSQLSNHQAVVSEKHNLQRQLDSLEVELEYEKRSKQRAKAKDESDAIQDLRARLKEAEKQLASEKKEQEKSQKKHDKELATTNSRCEKLEGKVSETQSKLKATQTELIDARHELENCQAELLAARNTARNAAPQRSAMATVGEQGKKKVAGKAPVNRKRRAADIQFDDAVIQTPGEDDDIDRRPAKKRGAEHLLVGEKSNFSVTPFLNRTKTLTKGSSQVKASAAEREPVKKAPEPEAEPSDDELSYHVEAVAQEPDIEPESDAEQEVEGDYGADPGQEEEDNGQDAESQHSSPPPPRKRQEKTAQAMGSKPAKPKGRQPAKKLGETSPSRANVTAASKGKTTQARAAGGRPKAKSGPAEQSDAENRSPKPKPPKKTAAEGGQPPTAMDTSSHSTASKPGEGEAKKKRRKLLGGPGKNIFDDDDGEGLQRPAVGLGGPARRMKTPLSGLTNAFAGQGFSPLKREKRGVHASFLAG